MARLVALLLLASAAPCLAAPKKLTPLAEMKVRHVVAADAEEATPEQSAKLRRLRWAERLGALDYLRDNEGTLAGSAVQVDSGEGFKRTLLTLEGYDRWLFTLSQEARRFFEKRGAEAKYSFQVKDVQGRRVFDDDGLLTDDGMTLYFEARARKKVFWRNPDGRLTGTVRPPAERLPAAPAPLPLQLPAPPAPEAEVKPGQMPEAGPIAQPGEAAAGDAVELSGDEARALAQAAGTTPDALIEAGSLKAAPFDGKMRYFLRPGDPLAKKLAELRGAPR